MPRPRRARANIEPKVFQGRAGRRRALEKPAFAESRGQEIKGGHLVNRIRERCALFLESRLVRSFILIFVVLAMSIGLLFEWEKQKLDAEFERIVASSLDTNTRYAADGVKREIMSALQVLGTAEAMLLQSGPDGDIQTHLEQRNASAPDYPTGYRTVEQLAENALGAADIRRLKQGATVISTGLDEAADALFVIRPLRGENGLLGVLYTRLERRTLLPNASEGGVYQNPYSCIITGGGEIVCDAHQPGHRGNLFDDLGGTYGLSQEEIRSVATAVMNGGLGSTAFSGGGQRYFLSSAHLQYNGWYMVSVVREADILLRSSVLFQRVVNTGVTAVLLTMAAAGVIFYRLLSSKRELAAAQRRNRAYASRFQAMFEQHSALKVLFDPETGEVTDANPAILRYFGFTKEEALRQNVYMFNLLPLELQIEKMRGEMGEGALFEAAPYRLRNGEIRLLDVYAAEIWDRERRLLYAILFDVTDRERYHDELLREKELLRITLQSIGDGVVTTNKLGMITGMNAVSERLTGWSNEQAMGRSFSEVFVLLNEQTGEPAENPVQKVLETGLVVGLSNHTELVSRAGKRIPIADSAAPIRRDEKQETLGVVIVFRDVSREKAHSREIEFLSYHDSLTGLYNRRYVEEAMGRLEASEKRPVSVIMADVNGLKITNDVFGHDAGDSLLKSVGRLMQENSGKDDIVARLGGDEFVILMPGLGLEEAEAVIRRIRDARVSIEGSGLSLSLSLGCACKDGPGIGLQAALQRAEENMYQQKLLEGKSYRSAIISTLLATLYEKSSETEEHSKRLERYCHAIGRKLRLSTKELDELSLLALLHDIGKVGVDPGILMKPGPLDDSEWEEIRRHPEIGYRIAQATPELAAVAELILSHHERWDGRGYPRRLKGEEIPLACRILAPVDAYDAMTSDRAYRRAMTVEEAIAELERNAGGQFEPRMAALLAEILKEEREPS